MKFRLEESVNHQVASLAVELKRQVLRIISKNNLDITPEQWIVLYYLWQEDGLTIGEIAARSKKDYGNITRMVDKLIKQGYVKKSKNKTDSRIIHVSLQPKAEEVKEQIHNCWIESTAIAMEGFSSEEQVLMLSLLKRMEDNIAKAAE